MYINCFPKIKSYVTQISNSVSNITIKYLNHFSNTNLSLKDKIINFIHNGKCYEELSGK